jgi:hypothetical protein
MIGFLCAVGVNVPPWVDIVCPPLGLRVKGIMLCITGSGSQRNFGSTFSLYSAYSVITCVDTAREGEGV